MKLKIIYISIFYILFLLSGCGKKLPPTSPDRWAPRVLNVNAVDEHHLRIFFSEKIDTLTPKKLDNFKILNPENGETTSVIYSERDKKGDEVLITVPKLEDMKYSLLIFNIKDIKGNLMIRAEKSFKPSNEKDTIDPILRYTRPSRIRTSAPLDSIILLRFSEPMDSGACGINDFVTTYIDIDSLFVWNETLTEVTLRYRLVKDKICKVFMLPLMPDLSGNSLIEMRILTLTTSDTLPKNRMNIKIIKDEKELTKTYAFLRNASDRLFQDISPVDTTFSFFFTPPDTYFISVVAQDSLDTTGLWWGEKKIAFFPDTTRSVDEEVEVDFIKRDRIPESLLNLYKILSTNIK